MALRVEEANARTARQRVDPRGAWANAPGGEQELRWRGVREPSLTIICTSVTREQLGATLRSGMTGTKADATHAHATRISARRPILCAEKA
jgi:hypothetical protein